MEQGQLFDVPSDAQRAFERYHRENPHVYRLLRKYSLEVLHAGKRHYSIQAVYHRLRWFLEFETKDYQDFKLNDRYSSRYARLLMQREPELAGFFFTRELRS